MKKQEKPKHGGKRPGAGRSLKFNEETTTVAFRIPVGLKEKVVETVQRMLKSYGKKKNKTGT
jgi:hypothetical protein